MSKTIRFDLPINGTKAKDLEALRENLTEEIIAIARSGQLARWLITRGHRDEAAEVTAAVAAHEADPTFCQALCEILGVTVCSEDIEAIFAPPKPAGKSIGETVAVRELSDLQAVPAPEYILGWPQSWPAEGVQALQRSAANALRLEPYFRDRLADGTKGPEMTVIPSGSFLMGAAFDEFPEDKRRYEIRDCGDALPRHLVRIARPFAIGRYAVTFDEYDQFCRATVRKKPDDEGWGRGRRPVINVSWDDAKAYCIWLSLQTGQSYQLPTEAEWEYAARAGVATIIWWGELLINKERFENIDFNDDSENNDFAKVFVRYCHLANPKEQTAPVGTLEPNPFGLYDMLGNVQEWVQDHWHSDYEGAPDDGVAWLDPDDDDNRVARGGDFSDLKLLHGRDYWDRETRRSSIGLRLARDF